MYNAGSLYRCTNGRYTSDTIIEVIGPHSDIAVRGRVVKVLPSEKRQGPVKIGQEWDVRYAWLKPYEGAAAGNPNIAFKIQRGRVAE